MISAHALRLYAAQAHPDWTPSGRWAGYNPIGGDYYLSFSGGGESHSLSYDFSGKTVRDTEREEALMEEQGLEAAIRSFQDWELPATSLVSLSMHWTVQDWEEPRVLLTVGLRDAPDQPLLEDSAIREKMVDRAAEVYDALAPRIGIQNLCVYYSYWGVQDQNGSPLSYRADVSVPDGTALSREDVISGVSAAV